MEGSLPQFDPTYFPSQIFWTAMTFACFYLVVRYVLMPRLGDVVDARLAKIEADLALAGELQHQAAKLQAECAAELEEAKRDASMTLNRQKREISRMVAEQEQQLAQKLDKQLQTAEQEIAVAYQSAILEIKAIAESTARTMLSSALGLKPTAANLSALSTGSAKPAAVSVS
jgi:F-type H+-transporting ATPase subunit b